MATQTLAELAKFVDDEIVRGVAEDIITTNPIWNFWPFFGYTGPGITVNREDSLGDSQLLSVGSTITARAPSVAAQQTFRATTLIGDVDMNGLVQAEGEPDGVDMTAQEISSKAKSVARLAQTQMAVGDGIAPNMNSFDSLVDSEQFTTASAGQALSFALLDELLDLVKSKDNERDWLMGPGIMLRQFKTLYRNLGGSDPLTVVITLPNGTTRNVTAFENIPFFQNDYLSIEETANGAALTGGNLTSVWAGNFDDGSKKVGLGMVYPISTPAGISVDPVGITQDRDEKIWRVKTYWNFANFNRRGLARLPSLTL